MKCKLFASEILGLVVLLSTVFEDLNVTSENSFQMPSNGIQG